jgi:erythromycin esterase-like protein
MGEYLRLRFGEKMVVIGTAFGGGSGDMAFLQRADPESFDGLLGAVGAPASLFWLHGPDTPAWVREAMTRIRRVRVNDRYGELDVLAAYDAIVYLDSLTPVREAPGGR